MPVYLLDLIDEPDDKRAFEIIYIHYQQMLFFEANEILHDEGLAEDAVLETFTRLARNFQKTDKKICHKLRNFLVIINKNICIDMLRARHRIIPAGFEDITDEGVSVETDPETAVQLEEAREMILNMPEIYRDVLFMSLVMQLDTGEISTMLQIPRDTVRKRMERGLKILRKERGDDR